MFTPRSFFVFSKNTSLSVWFTPILVSLVTTHLLATCEGSLLNKKVKVLNVTDRFLTSSSLQIDTKSEDNPTQDGYYFNYWYLYRMTVIKKIQIGRWNLTYSAPFIYLKMLISQFLDSHTLVLRISATT